VKALVKTRPEPGLDLLAVPEPTPGPGEVLLQVDTAAVCGSDVARFRWTREYQPGGAKAMGTDLPRILGHGYAGTVVELGAGVAGSAVGDRVTVQNVIGCWQCPACDAGLPNACDRRRTLGVHLDGGYAELAVVPARNCSPMPDAMDFGVGAALHAFAIATYAVDHAELRPGQRIVIWGAGRVGIAVLLAARLRGIDDVLVVDRAPDRLEAVAALGADTLLVAGDGDNPDDALVRRTGSHAVDAVFEAAGVPASVPASLPALRRRGPMVLIGNMSSAEPLDLLPLIMDQQRLIGTRSYSLAAWHTALRTAVRSGFAATLGEEVDIADAPARFAQAAEGIGGPFAVTLGR
jgi:threonine dehydrogenase-like Zn-dependent dehydrogenase